MDVTAAAVLPDPEYSQGLAQYAAAYEAFMQGIWKNHHVHRIPETMAR
jgi:hypothetical protein